jgi:hypothetical protein
MKKGHHNSWDLELPWLNMGYWFSKASLATFSPYFLLYGWDQVLPTFIRSKVEVMVDLDVATPIYYTYVQCWTQGYSCWKDTHIIVHHVTSLTFIVEWIHALLTF